ncbi:MAG TPA: hypothetical protein VFI13_06660 [Gemmatimonadales bacterium]|nr:hypothetical protein [Gemmatimonadales bacterium]
MRRPLLLVLTLLGAPCAVQGQVQVGMMGPALRSAAGWKLLPGVHYVNATGATFSLALLRVAHAGMETGGGYLIGGEAGLDGGKIGIGRGTRTSGGSGMIRLGYLRTWGSGGRLAPGQEFVGGDVRMGFRGFAFGVGWHRRISGSAPGERSYTTLSAGIGF